MQRDSDSIGARPSARPSSQLFVNHQGRKPLFSSRGDDGGGGGEQDPGRPSLGRFGARTASGDASLGSLRRTKSTSEPQSFLSGRRDNSNFSLLSSGGTRIPRPSSFARRRPISLTEALRMAEGEEEAEAVEEEGEAGVDHIQPVDGSPSPAPRPWRARNASDESHLRRILGEDHLDTKGQNKLPSTRNANLSGTLVATRDIAGPSSPPISPTAAKALGPGRGVARAASNEGLAHNRSSPARLSRFGLYREDLNGGIPDLVPGIEDIPLPSVEPPAANHASPEKSFAWQVDEDFTAGDLQVSDSPRIRIGTRPFANRLLYDDTGKLNLDAVPRLSHPGSRNTKLHDIMTRELQAGSNLAVLDRPKPRPQNTKIDDIRTRETQAEHQIPIPKRHLERLRNKKLEEIRQREDEGLSKRALAAARLEEIREQNSMSRPKSPESRPQSRRGLPKQSPKRDAVVDEIVLPARPRPTFESEAGRRIPDTPVTIFKRDPRRARDDVADKVEKAHVEKRRKREDERSKPPEAEARRFDDHELLRRLARAASSSPAVDEKKAQKLPTPPPADNQNTIKTKQTVSDKAESESFGLRRTSDNGKRTTNGIIKDSEKSKPTVEFAGVQRTRSTESAKSQRSSMQSEPDPTDRIEAEMSLFAPMENHSERGSTRAPSPPTDSDEEDTRRVADTTPRPLKQDPLTMPTPRVTGAYIETPATVKVEKRAEERAEAKPRVEEKEKPAKPEPPAPILRDRRASLAWRNKDMDTASDPGAADESDVGITTSAAVRRPRARSLPRRRPPVKNSAKPPSVRDDIRELQRAYNIEDSTVDDVEELISGRRAASRKLQQGSSQADFEADRDFDFQTEPAATRKAGAEPNASDGELAVVYERMNKTLQKGVLGILTAKQGIARLEGRFSQVKPPLQPKPAVEAAPTETQNDEGDHDHHKHHQTFREGCPHCASHPNPTTITYVHLPMPRLFRRRPSFRLTLLGMMLLILSLWYAAESAMCSMYCRPSTCPASKAPCVWSFDDPSAFGTAIPIKLDQWATGGYGREMLAHAVEEAHDWVADMQDLALGRDITAVDVQKLSFEQKRRHRRRLRKKGLAKPPREPGPEEKAKWDAWHQTRLAKQRVKEARDMGYAMEVDDGEGATIGGDQRVW